MVSPITSPTNFISPWPQRPRSPQHLPLDLPAEIRISIYRLAIINHISVLRPCGNMPGVCPTFDVHTDTSADSIRSNPRSEIRTLLVQVPCHIDYSGSHPGTRGLKVSLLRVSKQIHDEAAAVFYGENTSAFALGVTKRDHALDEENRVEYLPDRRHSWSSVPRVFEANQEVRNRRPNALRSLDQSPRVLPEASKKDRCFCCCFRWR